MFYYVFYIFGFCLCRDQTELAKTRKSEILSTLLMNVLESILNLYCIFLCGMNYLRTNLNENNNGNYNRSYQLNYIILLCLMFLSYLHNIITQSLFIHSEYGSLLHTCLTFFIPGYSILPLILSGQYGRIGDNDDIYEPFCKLRLLYNITLSLPFTILTLSQVFLVILNDYHANIFLGIKPSDFNYSEYFFNKDNYYEIFFIIFSLLISIINLINGIYSMYLFINEDEHLELKFQNIFSIFIRGFFLFDILVRYFVKLTFLYFIFGGTILAGLFDMIRDGNLFDNKGIMLVIFLITNTAHYVLWYIIYIKIYNILFNII